MRRSSSINTIICLVGIILISGCGTGSNSSTDTRDEESLKVGLEAGYAPFNWTQTDDSKGAVKIEGSKELCRRI